MPSITSSVEESGIGLAEMIESLRKELQTSLESGRNQAVKFDIDKVDLELKVALSRKAKGEGGIAFWVVKAGADVEAGRETSHTFKLSLIPTASATGARLQVGSSSRDAPARD